LIALCCLAILHEAPSMKAVVAFMDDGTLGLLFGMMIMVHLLSTTGVFEATAVVMVQMSSKKLENFDDMEKGPADDSQVECNIFSLTVYLCLATAILSAFLDNVTTMLLLAPVTIKICSVLDVDPVPLLISEVLFSNIGGTSTMIGDPPNIIIGNKLSEEVDFIAFIVNLMPCVIVAMPFCLMLLKCIYQDTLKGSRSVSINQLKNEYTITDYPLLLRSGLVFGTVILLLFLHPAHHQDAAWIAVIGAVFIMVVSTPYEIHHTLVAVEWDTMLFFAGLFVMIEALAEMGLIRAIGDAVTSLIKTADADARLMVALILLIWVSGLISGFLDNIPYTATMVPVIKLLADDDSLGLDIKPLAWALSLGACLGGNLTLVGASANLVTAGIAAQQGVDITFVGFTKIGAPIVFLSLTIATLYCLCVYNWAGLNP